MIMSNAGFIGAACRQLDAVLQRCSSVDNNILPKGDISAIKPSKKKAPPKQSAAYRRGLLCNELHF